MALGPRSLSSHLLDPERYTAGQELVDAVAVTIQRSEMQTGVVATLVTNQRVGSVGHEVFDTVRMPDPMQVAT